MRTSLEYITKFIPDVNPKSVSTILRKTDEFSSSALPYLRECNMLALEIETTQILDLVASRRKRMLTIV
jgi:hypothetical protein